MICNKQLNPKKDIFRHKLFRAGENMFWVYWNSNHRKIKDAHFQQFMIFGKKEHLFGAH